MLYKTNVSGARFATCRIPTSLMGILDILKIGNRVGKYYVFTMFSKCCVFICSFVRFIRSERLTAWLTNFVDSFIRSEQRTNERKFVKIMIYVFFHIRLVVLNGHNE